MWILNVALCNTCTGTQLSLYKTMPTAKCQRPSYCTHIKKSYIRYRPIQHLIMFYIEERIAYVLNQVGRVFANLNVCDPPVI